MAGRALLTGQITEIRIHRWSDGSEEVVHRNQGMVVEAPNWTPDGQHLIVNADGKLMRLAVDGGDLEVIDTGGIGDLNNDHVLSPDGRFGYVSSNDGQLYEVPIVGAGSVRRVSNDHQIDGRPVSHYLHGISPDGQTLAYVGLTGAVGGGADRVTDIFTVPVAGGADVRLTETPGQKDGCEYSPDGEWIYYNAEIPGARAGHCQLFRMRVDGSGVEQLTDDDQVNWFPHLSPDGTKLLYLAFPPGTEGHPENLNVTLKLAAPDGSDPVDLVQLLGGQGTTNVNGWAPDSSAFAYAAYPIVR